jgi:hypothetical protein
MKKRHIPQNYFHKQLNIQLALFVVAAIVVIGIVGYDVAKGNISIGLTLLGVLLGAIIGYVFANKMFKLKWNDDIKKIIVGRDRSSIIFIIIYIGLRAASNSLSHDFISSSVLTYFSLSTVGGIMLGRLAGMIKTIKRILDERQLL